jgi:RHS repeat-associated protein
MNAFGQPVASTGSSTDPYEFGATSGYRSDGDGASELPSGGSDGDGLVKVGCRYYDPATGSFVSRDTELDQAPYVYCDGDPVNAVDPSGHQGLIGNLIPRLLFNVGVVLAVVGFGIAVGGAVDKNPVLFIGGFVVFAIGLGFAITGYEEGGDPYA